MTRDPMTMTLGELEAMTPAERRAWGRQVRLFWSLDDLAELAADHARDVKDEHEQQQNYTAWYRQANT